MMEKKLALLALFCSFYFNVASGASNSMVPVSTQKINNASLTCPAGKWCKVVVNFSQYTMVGNSGANTGGVNSGTNPAIGSFEIILKSSEVLSAAASPASNFTSAANYSYTLISALTFSVGGSAIGKFFSTCNWQSGATSTGTQTAVVQSEYSFYSMEYYN